MVPEIDSQTLSDLKRGFAEFIDKTKKKAVVGKESFVAGDGIPRVKANVRFELLPNHLEIRAKKYYDLVQAYSQRFQVHPALILAVIHTESYFNPFLNTGLEMPTLRFTAVIG